MAISRGIVRIKRIFNDFRGASDDLRADSGRIYWISQVIRGGRVNRPRRWGLRHSVTVLAQENPVTEVLRRVPYCVACACGRARDPTHLQATDRGTACLCSAALGASTDESARRGRARRRRSTTGRSNAPATTRSLIAGGRATGADYQLSFTWMQDLESAPHRPAPSTSRCPKGRRAGGQAVRFAQVNEQLWIGHFDMWNNEGWSFCSAIRICFEVAAPTSPAAAMRGAAGASATESCDPSTRPSSSWSGPASPPHERSTAVPVRDRRARRRTPANNDGSVVMAGLVPAISFGRARLRRCNRDGRVQ